MDLIEGNHEAAEVYKMSQGQLITRGEHVIDINFQAVKTVMDLYGVESQRDCFDKVVLLARYFIGKGRDNGQA